MSQNLKSTKFFDMLLQFCLNLAGKSVTGSLSQLRGSDTSSVFGENPKCPVKRRGNKRMSKKEWSFYIFYSTF